MQQQFRDEWTNTFDLVHMRFGLAAAAEWGPPKVIASLVTLVKPGGWAQLVEPDWRDTTGCGPALAELLTLFGEIFDKMGTGADYAQKLDTWLADNSLQNIETRSFTIRIGAKNPEAELGRAGAQVICQAATSMVKVATHSKSGSITTIVLRRYTDSIPSDSYFVLCRTIGNISHTIG